MSTSLSPASRPPRVAIVGGGPAGLMAAETLALAGVAVDLYDAMPSVGRKFLLQAAAGSTSPTRKPSRPSPAATAAGERRSNP